MLFLKKIPMSFNSFVIPFHIECRKYCYSSFKTKV